MLSCGAGWLHPSITGTGCGSDVVNWDLNEAVPVHVFQHSYPVSQVELHPIDPNVLLTGSIFDSKIKLWDLRTPGKWCSVLPSFAAVMLTRMQTACQRHTSMRTCRAVLPTMGIPWLLVKWPMAAQEAPWRSGI